MIPWHSPAAVLIWHIGIIVGSALFAVPALSAEPAPTVEWVDPPAWRQSGSNSAALRPGMSISEGDTVITGIGGGASIRSVSGMMTIMEKSAWTWNGTTDVGLGDVQQGEVRIYQAGAPERPSTGAQEQGSTSIRVYPQGDWHLSLMSSPSRASAEELLNYLEKNGFPVRLVDAAKASDHLYQVSLPGLRSMDEALNAAQQLKGKFPGVVSPRAEQQFVAAAPASTQPIAAAIPRKPEAQASVACLEWGAFSPASVAHAQSLLDTVLPGVRVAQRRVEETPGWWVFMPPKNSRQEAIRKVGELKRLGIRDFFIVQEDPQFRFAISLGVFSTEDAAKNHLRQLQARGVRTGQVGSRSATVPKVFLQFRNSPQGTQPKLGNLIQKYPGTEFRECNG